MSKIQVTAISSFMHGRVHMNAGETGEFSKGDAEDLEKAGLVRVGDSAQSEQTGDPGPQAAPVVNDAAQDEDDILGDKAADPVENKMDPAPANKQQRAKK